MMQTRTQVHARKLAWLDIFSTINIKNTLDNRSAKVIAVPVSIVQEFITAVY